MQKFCMGVALATALAAAVPSLAREVTPSSASNGTQRNCIEKLLSLGKKRVPGWVSALVIGAMIGTPTVDQTIKHSLHHYVVAAVTGDRHLGNGIYFNDGDWEAVLAYLTPAERALLEASPRDELAVLRLFTEKVFGDYDETRIPRSEITESDRLQGIEGRRYHHYPLGIRGSHFVVARGQPRGNCEHKARVLQELLRRCHFSARLERAIMKDDVAHAYVVVRLSDGSEWIADGTALEVAPAEQYRARHVDYLIDYFGRPFPGSGKSAH
jgi:hypothetical protein